MQENRKKNHHINIIIYYKIVLRNTQAMFCVECECTTEGQTVPTSCQMQKQVIQNYIMRKLYNIKISQKFDAF